MRYVTIGGALALGLAVLSASLMLVPVAAQQPTFQRKILITQDLPVPGYQIVMAAVEIPPGVRSGRHTHPGTVVANIQEGVLTLEHEGRPTATYKAGDAYIAEAGKIHEDINNGTTPVKLIAVYVVEKGKPLTSPAP
jgi:quercetin dioxygenase-like cupin family protein